MARGDVHWFGSFLRSGMINTFTINVSADALKIGFVNNTTTPALATADPRWGAGGTTNFATNEVPTGAVYIAGGFSLAGSTWVGTATVTLSAAPVTCSQDVSTGFASAYYGIIYDNTSPGKHALGFVDLGGPVNNTAGAVTITWNSGGILTAVPN